MGRIFGTDGARGVANTEISCTLAMDIGRAAAMVVARDHHKRKPVFLVGHDTRISHDMLESAIAAGLCSVGADVVTLGTVPTPAVAYLVANSDADAAIMLSASHNPYEFNGIKIFGAEGFKLTDEVREKLFAYLGKGAAAQPQEALAVVDKDVTLSAATLFLSRWAWDLASAKVGCPVQYFPEQAAQIKAVAQAADAAGLYTWINSVRDARRVSEHPLNARTVIEALLLSYARNL